MWKVLRALLYLVFLFSLIRLNFIQSNIKQLNLMHLNWNSLKSINIYTKLRKCNTKCLKKYEKLFKENKLVSVKQDTHGHDINNSTVNSIKRKTIQKTIPHNSAPPHTEWQNASISTQPCRFGAQYPYELWQPFLVCSARRTNSSLGDRTPELSVVIRKGMSTERKQLRRKDWYALVLAS